MRLQIDWVSLIVRSKFSVFALYYFVFEGNFPNTLYLEGRFEEWFFASPGLEELIFGEDYFRNFMVLLLVVKQLILLFEIFKWLDIIGRK